MAKWYGNIGFADTVETEPGDWTETVVPHAYYGDVMSSHWKRQNSGGINDNINISTVISIVADPYAIEHCSKMAYIEYMGDKWKVTDVEPQFPRLLISMGGVYNGQ